MGAVHVPVGASDSDVSEGRVQVLTTHRKKAAVILGVELDVQMPQAEFTKAPALLEALLREMTNNEKAPPAKTPANQASDSAKSDDDLDERQRGTAAAWVEADPE